jgi:hypothetical protein
MSTSATPATVLISALPSPAALTVAANPIRTFLVHHERLIVIVLAAVLLWFFSGKIENVIAAHDNANLAALKVTAGQQADADKKTAMLVAQQAADFKALNDKLAAQDSALRQTNRNLSSALAQRQQTNNDLTTPELLTRWNQLVPNAGAAIVNGQTMLPDAGAHATVNELEKVPVLTGQLANEEKVASNLSELLASSTGQVSTLNDNVAGLKLELADNDKVCKAQIATVKAAARKSKRNWFIGGFITGFLTRQIIKTETGF